MPDHNTTRVTHTQMESRTNLISQPNWSALKAGRETRYSWIHSQKGRLRSCNAKSVAADLHLFAFYGIPRGFIKIPQ